MHAACLEAEVPGSVSKFEPRSEEHTSELQSLCLRHALPILAEIKHKAAAAGLALGDTPRCMLLALRQKFPEACPSSSPDRKSTRLNSSHFAYATLFRSWRR